jgi:hypothetical protein
MLELKNAETRTQWDEWYKVTIKSMQYYYPSLYQLLKGFNAQARDNAVRRIADKRALKEKNIDALSPYYLINQESMDSWVKSGLPLPTKNIKKEVTKMPKTTNKVTPHPRPNAKGREKPAGSGKPRHGVEAKKRSSIMLEPSMFKAWDEYVAKIGTTRNLHLQEMLMKEIY